MKGSEEMYIGMTTHGCEWRLTSPEIHIVLDHREASRNLWHLGSPARLTELIKILKFSHNTRSQLDTSPKRKPIREGCWHTALPQPSALTFQRSVNDNMLRYDAGEVSRSSQNYVQLTLSRSANHIWKTSRLNVHDGGRPIDIRTW